MQHLLAHGEADGISPLLCALECSRAELKTRDTRCEMQLFVPRSSGEKRGPGLPVIGPMASPGSREFAWFRSESPGAIPHLLGHCFGAFATPGGKLALLLCCRTLRVTVSICDGPSVNAELRPWESRPLA
jgi:hypothetical protein